MDPEECFKLYDEVRDEILALIQHVDNQHADQSFFNRFVPLLFRVASTDFLERSADEIE